MAESILKCGQPRPIYGQEGCPIVNDLVEAASTGPEPAHRDVRAVLTMLRASTDAESGDRPAAGSLAGAQLIGEDLSGLDLSGWNLAGAELSRADLAGARLAGADLRGAKLYEANLTGAELLSANLADADLTSCKAERCGFGAANLSRATLCGATLTASTFTQAQLEGADLRQADLTNAHLLEANLSDADFGRARLRGADLRRASVSGAILIDVDLRGARLQGLVGYATANWIGADTVGTDFTGAYLVRRVLADQNYLHEFRTQSKATAVLYWVWWLTSDCGRSFTRWGACIALVVLLFAGLFELTAIDPGDYPTRLSTLYYSVATLTTLGVGDIVPGSTTAQLLAIVEVVLGYVMLGGLLSIFSNKMARRAD